MNRVFDFILSLLAGIFVAGMSVATFHVVQYITGGIDPMAFFPVFFTTFTTLTYFNFLKSWNK